MYIFFIRYGRENKLLYLEAIDDIDDSIGNNGEHYSDECIDNRLFCLFDFLIVSDRCQELNTSPGYDQYSEESDIFDGLSDDDSDRIRRFSTDSFKWQTNGLCLRQGISRESERSGEKEYSRYHDKNTRVFT